MKKTQPKSKSPTEGMRTPDFRRSQLLIKNAEKLLGGKLICYWNSENGAITVDDAEAFRRLVPGTFERQKTLYLCLTSGGGSGLASLKIAQLLRRHCDRLVVLVPTRAYSAATMLALAADEIQLAPHANLSPVDTSVQHSLAPVNQMNDMASVGQDELARIVALWKKESIAKGQNPYPELWRYIHPLVIGAVDRANSMSLKLCDSLMAYHTTDADVRRRIAEVLTTGYPSHNYPILLPELQRIGIQAKEMAPDLEGTLCKLHECYVEAGKLKRIDTDQDHHHDHEIATLIECNGRMVLFRINRDWYYRTEEHRWLPMHDENNWYVAELQGKAVVERPLSIN